MQLEYHLLPKNILPSNFNYPKSYLHYLKYNETQEEVAGGCWEESTLIRYEDDDGIEVNFWHNQIRYEYPKKNFVPFARYADDIIYCFDGDDTSGDPRIYAVKVLLNEWGIDNQEFNTVCNNFYEWLELANEGTLTCAHWYAIQLCWDLPNGFSYPKCFLNKVKIWNIEDEKYMANTRFYFISKESNDLEEFHGEYASINKFYPHMNLILFATHGASKYLFAFDGNDISGNPKIYILNAFKSHIIGEYKDFQTWWDDIPLKDDEYREEEYDKIRKCQESR